MPSEPGQTTVKTLFALSGNRCAYTGCEERLTDPSWRQVQGIVCHIKGDNPGAPRYDSAQTEEQRHGFDNLLLLCPNHHRLIDYLEPAEHPVERLLEIKAKAEEAADRRGADWTDEESLAQFGVLAIQTYRASRSRGDQSIAYGEVGRQQPPDTSLPLGVIREGIPPPQVREGSTAEGRGEVI